MVSAAGNRGRPGMLRPVSTKEYAGTGDTRRVAGINTLQHYRVPLASINPDLELKHTA